jgi:hypothetical protein
MSDDSGAVKKAAEDALLKTRSLPNEEISLAVRPPAAASGALQFGPDDLVVGPSAEGKLRELQQAAGGNLLEDMEKPLAKTWSEFILDTFDQAAASRRQVHFDKTYIEDIESVLAGRGAHADKITSQVLRHLRDQWEAFKCKPKFYHEGKEVAPPWLKS